jgi:hypothetical protein
LQDVSLNKKDGPIEANKVAIIDFEVELETESTEGDETKPQEGHNREDKKVLDLKSQCVVDLKKKKTFLRLLYISIHII